MEDKIFIDLPQKINKYHVFGICLAVIIVIGSVIIAAGSFDGYIILIAGVILASFVYLFFSAFGDIIKNQQITHQLLGELVNNK